VADSVALMGATLDIPAFTKGSEHLSAGEIENTRKIANVRIHVESNRSCTPKIHYFVSNRSSH